MGKIIMCKDCGGEWEMEPRVRKVPMIIDEADHCPYCDSYEIAPKVTGIIGRIGVVEGIVRTVAHLNKAMEVIEPIKKAIDDIEKAQVALWNYFDELTNGSDFGQVVNDDRFYSVKTEDEIKTVVNAATSHIEEW